MLFRSLHRSQEPFVFNWSEQAGPRSPREEYTPEKVEDLKKNLLIALKNAAHIRNLKSDETVTVVVTGRAAAPEPKANPKKISDRTPPGADGAPHPGVESKPGRLLVRARKSDAEAFLKDKLNLDEFRKKATVFIY